MNLWMRDKVIRYEKSSFSIFVLYAMLTTAIYVLPYAKYVLPYVPVALLMIISLPIIMLKRYRWLNYGIILLGFSFLVLLINLLNENFIPADAVNEFIRNVRFFIPVLWGSYALYYTNKKQQKIYLLLLLLIIVYILYQTLNALAEDMWIARILAEGTSTSSSETNAYRLQNIGGFEFSYMMCIVTLCLTWSALNVKKIWVKICSIIACVVCFYYIIQTMYTILLLLTAIGMIILLYIRIKSYLGRFVFLVSALGVYLGLVSILDYLAGLFGDSLLALKFTQISMSLTGGEVDALGSRPQLIKSALQNWLQHPIFGGAGENSNTHSLFVSLLEQTGIVGITMWLIIFYMSWKIISTDLERYHIDASLFNVSTIVLFAMSCLNPMGYVFEVTIATFFVVPVWLKVCSDVK